MIDFGQNMTRNIKELLPALERGGFRYLSTDGHSLFQTISDNLRIALEQNEVSLSAPSDNPKENNDKKWVSILNFKENWERFKKNKSPTQIKDINMLNQFWDSQNQFALASNESLVEYLNIILFCLNHVQAAIKEYEINAKSKRNLDKKFIKIHSLNEHLKTVKSQLTNAMLVRLKIAHSYSNRKNDQIPDVDDVVYYISHSLNNRKALSVAEKEIPPTELRKTLFTKSQNYYVKFYDYVKKYGESKEEKKQIDAFHWSRIINKPVFPLTTGIPDYNSIGSNKVFYYGFSFSEFGKEHKTKIAIPSFLNKFAPERYQTPAWFYWQDNMILDFWSKRQEFLANLQCFWSLPENGETKNKANHEKCISFINDELRRLSEEKPSFFAFSYKDMLKEWNDCLKNLRSQLLTAVKIPAAQSHVQVTQKTSRALDEKDSAENIKSVEKIEKVKKNKKPDAKTSVNEKQSIQKNQGSILEMIKRNEDEYQEWQSDSSDKSEALVYPDSKNLKCPTYLFAIKEKRLIIQDSDKNNALLKPKELEAKKISEHINKVSPKLLQRVY